MDAIIVLEIWDILQEYVPVGKKSQSAQDLVNVFYAHGLDESWFDDILGEDPLLDRAIDLGKDGDSPDSDDDDDHDE